MDKILAQKIKSLKSITPNKDWVFSVRENLMIQAENLTQTEKNGKIIGYKNKLALGFLQIKSKFSMHPIAGFVSTIALIVGIILPGMGIMANSSLPGNFLYPVKMAIEQVELSLTQTREAEINTYLKFSDRRIQELSEILESENIDNLAISQTMAQLKTNLKLAKINFDIIQENKNTSKTLELAKILNNKSNFYEKLLITNRQKISYQNRGLLYEILDVANEMSNSALACIISEHEQGNKIAISEQEVVASVQEKIQDAEEKIKNVRNKIAKQSWSVRKTRSVVLKVRKEIVQPDQASEEAEKTLAKAKELLEQKKFSLAMEKVQETEEINKSTEEVVGIQDAEEEIIGEETEDGKVESEEYIGEEVIEEEESEDVEEEVILDKEESLKIEEVEASVILEGSRQAGDR